MNEQAGRIGARVDVKQAGAAVEQAGGAAENTGAVMAVIPAGLVAARVTSQRDGQVIERDDVLADEVPIAMVYNGITQVVMLATPADLDDFALGFGLSEGLLAEPAELLGVDVVETCEGIELQLEVLAACEMRLKDRRRALVGRTGCGICGAESLQQLHRTLPALPVVTTSAAVLAAVQRQLPPWQALQRASGATHAAAWCGPDGAVRLVREDVGRHNALDKLIGALTRTGFDPADGFIWISSRASYEMVQKTAMAGIGLLAATSAPTARAVALAREAGLALAGFVRGENLVAYTWPERFAGAGQGDLS